MCCYCFVNLFKTYLMPYIPNNNGWVFAFALVRLCLNNCPFKWPLLFGYAKELITLWASHQGLQCLPVYTNGLNNILLKYYIIIMHIFKCLSILL